VFTDSLSARISSTPVLEAASISEISFGLVPISRAKILAILVLPVLRYNSLHSNYYDLGIYLNRLANVIDNPLLVFDGHVQLFLYPYSFFYNSIPPFWAPQALIFSQSLLIVVSLLLLYKYFGIFIAVVASLYPPIWFNALFDFHLDHLALPILIIFFIFCHTHKFTFAFLISILLLFTIHFF